MNSFPTASWASLDVLKQNLNSQLQLEKVWYLTSQTVQVCGLGLNLVANKPPPTELQFCILNHALEDTKAEAPSSEVTEWACIRSVNKNKDLYICKSQVNVTVNI